MPKQRTVNYAEVIELWALGMSQAQVAASIGCSQSHVSKIVRTTATDEDKINHAMGALTISASDAVRKAGQS